MAGAHRPRQDRHVVVLLVGLAWASACAKPTPAVHAQWAEQAAGALHQMVRTEIALHDQRQIDDASHQQWQQRFKVCVQALRAYVAAIRAQQPAGRVAALRDIGRVLDELRLLYLPRVRDGSARLALTVTLDAFGSVMLAWAEVT